MDTPVRFTIGFTENFPIPGRFYVHPAGFREVYRADGAFAAEQTKDTLFRNQHILRAYPFHYFIGLVWGMPSAHQNKERLDLFGLTFDTNVWPGNADILPLFFEGKQYVTIGSGFCGDGALLLAAEERYRRTTRNLEEFVRSAPDISTLLHPS